MTPSLRTVEGVMSGTEESHTVLLDELAALDPPPRRAQPG
jgi:hypothetical protein